MQNAKAANMPKDTVERAIKKATDKDAGDYKEITYEGYGPHGIAIFVEAATDNNTRTVANVRSYFTKHGGSLGTQARSRSSSTTSQYSRSSPRTAWASRTSSSS